MSEKVSVSELVSLRVRPEIQALSAYHVPSSKGFLKLDAMENPYSWNDTLKQQWLERLAAADVNRYPDPSAEIVKAKLYTAMNIPREYGLLLGNGSDELIQILAMALAKPNAVVMAPEPSFVMYKMIATLTDMRYEGVPLNAAFQLDINATLSAIAEFDPAIIFLAQPNNPTGKLFEDEHIRQILTASNGLVVVDEAYMAFTDRNAIPLLQEFDNLLVMRTVSKIGLAGLRLGFLIGSKAWLQELDKVRLPYNINILTQLSAEFALDNYTVLMQQAQLIKTERKALTEQLRKLDGFTVFASDANFILLRAPTGNARIIFEGLKDEKVLIKCLDGSHPSLQGCLRITVGTPDESKQFLSALTQVLNRL